MDALILAAGLGSRLREVEPCKPLTRLHGRTLLEIGIRQLTKAGATRVIVATGYQAEIIEAELPAIARRAGIPVQAKRVGDYTRPNGYSVLAGAEHFQDDFILVMADHIFSLAALAALVDGPAADGGTILAIDRRVTSPLIDPDDATWVATGPGGTIRRIGKAIENYDAVDCGAFKASPALLAAIRAAIDNGLPGSLSDGMQYLANAGQAHTVDIGGAWWMDVDDAHALGLANAQICAHLPEIFAQDAAV